MSEKKQSSIDWLIDKIQDQRESGETDLRTTLFYCEQAKAMHQQEIEEAYDGVMFDDLGRILNGKQYYNETFNK